MLTLSNCSKTVIFGLYSKTKGYCKHVNRSSKHLIRLCHFRALRRIPLEVLYKLNLQYVPCLLWKLTFSLVTILLVLILSAATQSLSLYSVSKGVIYNQSSNFLSHQIPPWFFKETNTLSEKRTRFPFYNADNCSLAFSHRDLIIFGLTTPCPKCFSKFVVQQADETTIRALNGYSFVVLFVAKTCTRGGILIL